jgi:hypothetical protein
MLSVVATCNAIRLDFGQFYEIGRLLILFIHLYFLRFSWSNVTTKATIGSQSVTSNSHLMLWLT